MLRQDQKRSSIELFAGAGGLGIGLSLAGFEPCMVVENNHWCCETLRGNHNVLTHGKSDTHSAWRVIEGDIREISFKEFDADIDLVSGGPPCQPFSLGGQHYAYDDARDMFPQAVRAIREARPKAFVFENVKGLTRTSFLSYFEYIKLQLEHPEIVAWESEDWQDHHARLEQHHTSRARPGLHYKVVTKLLNAANFGVPQRRERVLFVGFRDDVDARWSFKEDGTHSQAALIWDQLFGDYWDRHKVAMKDRGLEGRAKLMARHISKDEKPCKYAWRTTRDAIHDLPDPEKKIEAAARIDNHKFQPGARVYPGHTGSYLDESSKTLKAGVHGVPGGENMLRRANGSVRYFSTREAARIQTFPDDYRLHGAWSECMRQIGNAVPVELARVVGESVAKQLVDVT